VRKQARPGMCTEGGAAASGAVREGAAARHARKRRPGRRLRVEPWRFRGEGAGLARRCRARALCAGGRPWLALGRVLSSQEADFVRI
jgi:hypothetical protein